MRWGTLLLAACVTAPTGCSLARNTVHNLANESVTNLDERKLSRQLRADARACWQSFRQQSGGAYSADFEAGFLDGFADYLESGGNGAPPAVPPLRYRRSHYLTPEGHAQVREYFAGFKAGLDVAAATGRRQFLTVPVLVSDPPPTGAPPGAQLSTGVTPIRAGEQLPSPRKMDPISGLPIPARPLSEQILPTQQLSGKDKVPDLAAPKLSEPPPPSPAKSEATPTKPDDPPAGVPTRAEVRPPPEWPLLRRKVPAPDDPPLGRRRLDRD